MQQSTVEISTAPDQKRGRLILVLLFLFFVLPLIAVLLMHHYQWHPQGSSNGALISPARPLHMANALLDEQARPLMATVWRDKWSMVYVAESCDSVCAERLHGMRQLHVSFAKDIERIQRVLISPISDSAVLRQQYPDLVIINQPATALANLSQQFDIAGQSASAEHRIYLVDPLGNLMMSYTLTTPLKEIRKDLERLLRYSWAG